jgi:hypothetical protein
MRTRRGFRLHSFCFFCIPWFNIKCCNSLCPVCVLHQLLPMDQQLAMITHLCTGRPDAWKSSFQQHLQNMVRVPSIGLLFRHIAGTNLRRIAAPHLMARFCNSCTNHWSLPTASIPLRQLTPIPDKKSFSLPARMHQLVVFECAGLRIQHGDLLETGVKITTYDDHAVSFLPLVLVSKPTTVYRDPLLPSTLSNQLSLGRKCP